jgi:hypothetical protein
MHDVLEVAQASRQPVDAGDDQGVSGPQDSNIVSSSLRPLRGVNTNHGVCR